MKKEWVIAISACISLSQADANEIKQGFSGELGAFALYQETRSHLSVREGDVLSSLENEAGKVSTSNVIPLGSLRYQFDNHQVFVGQSEDTFVRGVLALELGYKNQFDKSSSLTVAVAPTVIEGEVWSNPFLVSGKREKSDIEGNVYRVKYEYQLIELDLAYYDRNIATEASQSQLLQREGNGYFTSLGVVLPLSMSLSIVPSIYYQNDMAQGKALAFSRVGTGLLTLVEVNEYSLALNGKFSSSEYDASHPLFGVIREEDQFHFSFSFEARTFLGVPQMSLMAQLAYEKSNANIAFYNEEDVSILIGGLYRF